MACCIDSGRVNGHAVTHPAYRSLKLGTGLYEGRVGDRGRVVAGWDVHEVSPGTYCCGGRHARAAIRAQAASVGAWKADQQLASSLACSEKAGARSSHAAAVLGLGR